MKPLIDYINLPSVKRMKIVTQGNPFLIIAQSYYLDNKTPREYAIGTLIDDRIENERQGAGMVILKQNEIDYCIVEARIISIDISHN